MTVVQGILGGIILLGGAALICGTLMTKHSNTHALGAVSQQICNRNASGLDNDTKLRRVIAVVSGIVAIALIVITVV